MPGVIAGALLAFALSIDDFIITEFNAGSMQTFPIWVYGSSRVGTPPQVNVMGTLVFAFGILLGREHLAAAPPAPPSGQGRRLTSSPRHSTRPTPTNEDHSMRILARRRRRRRVRRRRDRGPPRLLRAHRGRRLRRGARATQAAARRRRPRSSRRRSTPRTPTSVAALCREHRHHPRDERGRPALRTCRSSTAPSPPAPTTSTWRCRLSQPHPDAPYEQTGVKLGDEQFAQSPASGRRAGRLALVGIGVEPGLSDVFARYAADHLFCEIDELGIRDGANLVVPTTTATRSSRRRSRSGPRSRSASTRR